MHVSFQVVAHPCGSSMKETIPKVVQGLLHTSFLYNLDTYEHNIPKFENLGKHALSKDVRSHVLGDYMYHKLLNKYENLYLNFSLVKVGPVF